MMSKKQRTINYKRPLQALAFIGVFGTSLLSFVPQAKACCSCLAQSYIAQYPTIWATEGLALPLARIQTKIGDLSVAGKTTSEYKYLPGDATGHRAWIRDVLWEGKDPETALVSTPGIGLKYALEDMAKQVSSIATLQTMIFGKFLDATHQLETQQSLQKLSARAHKDYQTSLGVCEFGTNVKSLAASEEKSQNTAALMNAFSQKRNTANAATLYKAGQILKAKTKQFAETFCDPKDFNGKLNFLCLSADGKKTGGQNPSRHNKDIDVARTLSYPLTLDINFTDTTLTDTEEDILALTDNLYGHDVVDPIASEKIPAASNTLKGLQEKYMDMRSLLAKDSVARNSFTEIVALKSPGTSGSKEYLLSVLENMTDANLSQKDIEQLLAGDPNASNIEPSYYAQMDILTKKIIQNPKFFSDLYDKPANVSRKMASLQAIGLMQKFDLFKSHLRNEANLSLLLEMKLMRTQKILENNLLKAQ